jgi:hypothetical protein
MPGKFQGKHETGDPGPDNQVIRVDGFPVGDACSGLPGSH